MVCRQLGFEGASTAVTSAGFGPGIGNIWMDGVYCVGNENTLAECNHHGWGQHNCDHSGGGHWGLQSCGVGQFFLRYFGNFNLELRYCGILQTCGMRFFGILDGIKNYPSSKSSNVFRAFSSFRLCHFLLIISQHPSGCYLFCFFCLNRTFQNLHFCFRVICSKLNIQCSGFSMTSSFDTVL